MTRNPNQPIPVRHPQQPGGVPMIGPLVKLLGITPPTDAEWRAIGAALTVSDQPMDQLVDWMFTVGMMETRRQFDQALAAGIDSVADAPAPLREFFTFVETPPDWVDWDLIRLGEQTMQSAGIDGIYLARDVAFLGGFVASGINRTLMLTNSGKSGQTGSAQRFAETLRWALDVTSTDGLRPGGPGYRSTLHVRLIHTLVRRHIAQMPEWEADEWGVPINQTDMAATMLGALVAPAVGALAMGMLFTPRELEGVAHVARYAGWLMGIEERYLATSFRGAVRNLYHYLMALTSPDETTRQLAPPMAADPFSWYYPNFAPVRRRIAWAQHLSITWAFLGPTRMRQLGLPIYMPPWYPPLRIPINFARTVAALTVPGGRRRQAQTGLRQQHAFMSTLIGPTTGAKIGGVANYVRGAA
jgi:ER-bound oxygenase mpaB/B'/Rubber oxygenase, catalytic domain